MRSVVPFLGLAQRCNTATNQESLRWSGSRDQFAPLSLPDMEAAAKLFITYRYARAFVKYSRYCLIFVLELCKVPSLKDIVMSEVLLEAEQKS